MTIRRFIRDSYPIDDLPRDLHPQLPAGRRVRVIIEDDISDEDLLAEFEAEIQKGLDDLDAGHSHPAEEVLAYFEQRAGRNADAAE